ncbi:transcription initiation factor IIB [Halorarius halobius]|uniref:transcription initiation factor IIB n=1 Tax=Halorarius halobius TaxID=2962671 RepID=UPI0020CC454A|nr:transcription initiation factor IIB family protein [Halorarius halobius]
MQRADVYERRYDESTEQTESNTCPECDGRVTMTRAETVCDDCGLVLADGQVDTGAEWRNFEDTENRARTGAPRTPSRHDRGLSTEIGWDSNGANSQLPPRKRRQLSRLRREQARAQHRNKRERNEMHGLLEIRRMTGALGFENSFRDRACRLFSTAQGANLLRGRSIEAIAAASVYAACRCEGRPQTLGDVSRVARASREKVKNGYGVLNRELELPAAPIPPEQYLPRFVSELGLSPGVERVARSVLDRGETPETNGSHPAAVAGGALLVAVQQSADAMRFTQAELAEVADVSIVSLRRYRDELEAMV